MDRLAPAEDDDEDGREVQPKGHFIAPERCVLIDRNLSFVAHIRRLTASCRRRMRQLRKIRLTVNASVSRNMRTSEFTNFHFYRATACNATRGIANAFLSVRPSVCLSNAYYVTKRKKLVPRLLIPHKRSFILVFWQEEWLWGQPLLPDVLGQTDPVGAKTPIFNRYSLVAPQSQHLPKKSSINTNRKSTTRLYVRFFVTRSLSSEWLKLNVASNGNQCTRQPFRNNLSV